MPTNTTERPTLSKVICRQFLLAELLGQIGRMTVLGVSGGRKVYVPELGLDGDDGQLVSHLVLPVTSQIAVLVVLNALDYYDVYRIDTSEGLGGDNPITYSFTDVSCFEVSQAVWQVSCYESYP